MTEVSIDAREVLTTGPDGDEADGPHMYRMSVRRRVVNEPWPMASC